jgi:hypothetical protein
MILSADPASLGLGFGVIGTVDAATSTVLFLTPAIRLTIGAPSPPPWPWVPGDEYPVAVCHLPTAVEAGLEDAAPFCFNGDFGNRHWQVPFRTHAWHCPPSCFRLCCT